MRGVLCYCCCQTPTTAAISSLSLFPKRNPSPGSLPSRSICVSTTDPQVFTGNPLLPRRLILLRHAESAAPGRFLRDHDRPLSKSGRADAIEVTKKLREMGWIPELILSRCMGHNRGWEEAASMFSGASVELKMCNAALLEATGKSWNEAFALAGLGGWKLHDIVEPDASS